MLLAASFDKVETSLLFNTSGIHAVAENSPRRISTAMDGEFRLNIAMEGGWLDHKQRFTKIRFL